MNLATVIYLSQAHEVAADVYEQVFSDLKEGEMYSVEVFGFVAIGDEELESPPAEASTTTSMKICYIISALRVLKSQT